MPPVLPRFPLLVCPALAVSGAVVNVNAAGRQYYLVSYTVSSGHISEVLSLVGSQRNTPQIHFSPRF